MVKIGDENGHSTRAKIISGYLNDEISACHITKDGDVDRLNKYTM